MAIKLLKFLIYKFWESIKPVAHLSFKAQFLPGKASYIVTRMDHLDRTLKYLRNTYARLYPETIDRNHIDVFNECQFDVLAMAVGLSDNDNAIFISCSHPDPKVQDRFDRIMNGSHTDNGLPTYMQFARFDASDLYWRYPMADDGNELNADGIHYHNTTRLNSLRMISVLENSDKSRDDFLGGYDKDLFKRAETLFKGLKALLDKIPQPQLRNDFSGPAEKSRADGSSTLYDVDPSKGSGVNGSERPRSGPTPPRA